MQSNKRTSAAQIRVIGKSRLKGELRFFNAKNSMKNKILFLGKILKQI